MNTTTSSLVTPLRTSTVVKPEKRAAYVTRKRKQLESEFAAKTDTKLAEIYDVPVHAQNLRVPLEELVNCEQ